MWTFTVDARDGTGAKSCEVCCCQGLTARPGETNKISIDYTPWVVPLRGKGLSPTTEIDISRISPVPDNLVQIAVTTTVNTPVAVNLPAGSTVIPMYEPKNGQYDFDTDTYTPDTGFTGADRFFFRDPDGYTGEVTIGVGTAAPAFQKPIDVPGTRISVKASWNVLDFPIIVSPTARENELYRITVRQSAYDCDAEGYAHLSCYDVKIGKCGW